MPNILTKIFPQTAGDDLGAGSGLQAAAVVQEAGRDADPPHHLQQGHSLAGQRTCSGI